MKAVVAEIREPYAAVLAQDGTFRKIRNNNYKIGQTIELTGEGLFSRKRLRRAAAAAAAVLVMSTATLWYSSENVMAYSTVTVSVDGSEVELVLNRRDEVIGAKARNESDAEAAETAGRLEVSRFRRKTLENVLESISEEGNEEILAVQSRNSDREQKLEQKARNIIRKEYPEEETAEDQSETGTVKTEEIPGGDPDEGILRDTDGEPLPEGGAEENEMPEERTGEEEKAEILPENEDLSVPGQEAPGNVTESEPSGPAGSMPEEPSPGTGQDPVSAPEQAGGLP